MSVANGDLVSYRTGATRTTLIFYFFIFFAGNPGSLSRRRRQRRRRELIHDDYTNAPRSHGHRIDKLHPPAKACAGPVPRMDAWRTSSTSPFSAFSFSNLTRFLLANETRPQAPEICTLYCLNVPPSAVRAVIRQRFEKNRYVSDPKVIDVLIHKSRQDYQEAVNFWKQEPHVLGPLLSNRDRPQRTFMQKFLEGGSPSCASLLV
jgi:hypothetical protein